jgi:hypothetical protein
MSGFKRARRSRYPGFSANGEVYFPPSRRTPADDVFQFHKTVQIRRLAEIGVAECMYGLPVAWRVGRGYHYDRGITIAAIATNLRQHLQTVNSRDIQIQKDTRGVDDRLRAWRNPEQR